MTCIHTWLIVGRNLVLYARIVFVEIRCWLRFNRALLCPERFHLGLFNHCAQLRRWHLFSGQLLDGNGLGSRTPAGTLRIRRDIVVAAPVGVLQIPLLLDRFAHRFLHRSCSHSKALAANLFVVAGVLRRRRLGHWIEVVVVAFGR